VGAGGFQVRAAGLPVEWAHGVEEQGGSQAGRKVVDADMGATAEVLSEGLSGNYRVVSWEFRRRLNCDWPGMFCGVTLSVGLAFLS
jgi:hypothetical protein